MVTGLKHLITCRCILQQFKRQQNPPSHQFVVFSIIDDDVVEQKFVTCNNCGIVHRVTEINKSEIVQGREEMKSIVTIDDIKLSLPARLSDLLESNNADIATWEYVQYIYENKQWGNFVVLTMDEESGTRQGKYVRILGENMFKVEPFVREEIIK
jgi:myosin-crossreactive antigen